MPTKMDKQSFQVDETRKSQRQRKMSIQIHPLFLYHLHYL